MKIEGLKDALNALIEQEQELRKNAKQIMGRLLEALIEESPIKMGDKVLLFKTELWGSQQEKVIGEGIVTGFFLREMNLDYSIAKIKKNGMPSEISWSKWQYTRIEKIEQ